MVALRFCVCVWWDECICHNRAMDRYKELLWIEAETMDFMDEDI
jgi:hypothetical protein